MINPWNDMKNNTRRRVDGYNRYDIFWMVDLDGRYTFGIELDFCIKASKRSVKFIGLNTLRKDSKDSTKFYIALNDNSNWQLFVLVCKDIISFLNTCNNGESVVDSIETRLLKWKKFFISSDDDFGIEKQMGLFGELSFLSNIAAKQVGFEEALNCWVGADFDKQDFLFNDCAVEIKTHKASKSPNVTISSAYQLYTSKEKLYLVVYSLSIHSQGLSVEDIVKSIEVQITDVESFYKKLFSCGYKANFQAEPLKFKIDKILFFDVDDKFPKITSMDIDSRIHNLKYTIDFLKCNEFLLDKIKL